MRTAALAMLVMGLCGPLAAAENTFKADRATVTYSGIGEPYAKAIARTAAAARNIAAGEFGYDMPEAISINVTCAPDQKARLWTDGRDHFSLTVPSENDLRKPAETGIFHLYGMCHEVGHLAQYRLVPKHDWMTSAAAEGWAHYLGSRLVDGVYAREGPDLWPDKYDYRADGMARLAKQAASAMRDEVTDGAALWMELAGIVGDKGVPAIFKAWGAVEIDSADPGPALGKALLAANKNPQLAAWWKKAEPVLVLKRARSTFVAKTATAAQLAGKPAELARDDGTPAGKMSLTGGGHAVSFEAPSAISYLVGVRIYGSRYGAQQAPAENFHVWLCDEEFKAVADFPFPYAAFEVGNPKWVALPVRPALVPQKFILCVGFDPTSTKGVFVHRDAASSGNSFTGLPGAATQPFSAGDWMIRATVDQAKAGPGGLRKK
ncbi:MAG: hypothetical protein NTX87_11400 [Planctomycetota bacterium]|nr:hypothetical protein [Planctomycetota bacterium]